MSLHSVRQTNGAVKMIHGALVLYWVGDESSCLNSSLDVEKGSTIRHLNHLGGGVDSQVVVHLRGFDNKMSSASKVDFMTNRM